MNQKISINKLFAGLIILIVVSQIIPALLNASSNIAVILGVAMILGIFWAVYNFWGQITTFFKEDE